MNSIRYLFLTGVLLCNLACQAQGTRNWQFITPMPHGRGDHAAVLGPDGCIYVMGGRVFKVVQGFKKGEALDGWMLYKWNSGQYSNLRYDPRKEEWQYLMPVPGWMSSTGGFFIYDRVINVDEPKVQWIAPKDAWGKMFADILCYYETSTETLEYIFTVPEPNPRYRVLKGGNTRQGAGVALLNGESGKIYWIGGAGYFIGLGEDVVLPYDIKKDEWPAMRRKKIRKEDENPTEYLTAMPRMHEYRSHFSALGLPDKRIFSLGGWHQERGIDMVSKTVECYDPKTNLWEYKKPMFRERMAFAAAAGQDGRIYVFGGAAGYVLNPATQVLDTTEIYDPRTDTWSYGRPIPKPRCFHAAVLGADGRIYVLGGNENLKDEVPYKTVFIYDPRANTWAKGPNMNVARNGLAAVATPDGKIYAIGGSDIGAYKTQDTINELLPGSLEGYSGKVQDTVEVLTVNEK